MKFLSSLCIAGALLATPAFAAPFTADELPTAAEAAIKAFKAEFGEEVSATIYAVQVQAQRSGGKAKIYYKQGEENLSLDFFCHYHGGEIDCHEM